MIDKTMYNTDIQQIYPLLIEAFLSHTPMMKHCPSLKQTKCSSLTKGRENENETKENRFEATQLLLLFLLLIVVVGVSYNRGTL